MAVRILFVLLLLVGGTIAGAVLAKYWLKWDEIGVVAGAATGALVGFGFLSFAAKVNEEVNKSKT